MTSRDYQGRHRGLTMSELMVILAVIIIGSAIVLAMAARGREVERTSAVPAPMQRLSTAVRLYVRDSGGYFKSSDSHEARMVPVPGEVR